MNRLTPRAMLRTLVALGAVTALGPGLSACGVSSGYDGLIVGSDLTYPPYAYFEGKDPSGFDPDFVRAIGDHLGEDVSIQDTRFEQLIPNLKAGHSDLVASALYITPERAEQVDFIPYFSTGNSIVVPEDAAPLRTVDDLCGKVVATIKGGDIVDQLRTDASGKCRDAGKRPIDVREFTTDPEGTQAMLSAQVDAQVTDAGVATTLNEKDGVKVKITSDELLYPIPVGIGIWKGDDGHIREQLDGAIDEMKADGTYDALLGKYNLAPVDQRQVDKILNEQPQEGE
jgi:ABC-type amino acid transport substrate-binding protein